jgi:hypothetical protein
MVTLEGVMTNKYFCIKCKNFLLKMLLFTQFAKNSPLKHINFIQILISFNQTKSIMKTQLKKTTIFMLLVICITTSCKKDKNKTPEDYRVTIGSQTFGAYLNGQPWVADYNDPGNGVGPIDVGMFRGGGVAGIPNYYYLWVTAKKNNEAFSIYLPSPLKIGRVMLNQNTFPYPAELYPKPYGQFEIYTPYKSFITNQNVTGFVDILSVDTVRKDIEATFEFEAINTTTQEKVKITNGYFKR